MTGLERTLKAIRDVFLYVLLFLSAISYHPTVMRMSRYAGYDNGTIFSRYIVLLFGAIFILSISISAIKHSKMVRDYLICLIVVSVFALFILAFFRNKDMVSELRTFIIVLGSMMIGYDLQISEKKYAWIILVFCVTAFISGLMQVLVNIGGFRIVNQYLADSKNSLGAMLATSSFAYFYLAKTSHKSYFRFICWGLMAGSLIVMITIRARMAMVALLLVVMFYYYLIKRNKNIIISMALIGIAAFFLVLLMPGFIVDYLEDSFTAGTQGEDFTSGRLYTYAQAISYLMESPLLGNIYKYNQIGWVHNYLLLKLYDFGVLFSWPIFVLYFVVLISTINKSYKAPPYSRECFGYVCVLIPFVISMGEPTFPFGPGTVNVFNFILLGISEKELMMRRRAMTSSVPVVE